MPVPSSISDLSTTPALNSPAGTESPSTVDDYLRTFAAFIKQVDGGAVKAAGLAAPGGSALVGYDGGTAQDVLDDAKPMANYTALRAYTGRATGVRITQTGLAGFFWRDASDTTSADNGGTVIVDAGGRRWKRLFSGEMEVKWFGAIGDGTADDSAAIVAAVAAIPGGVGTLRFPSGTYKWTGVITLPARVNVTGDGGEATVLSPTGDGFQVVQGTTDVGLTVYRDFTIRGVSRTANTAFAMGFSTSIANQLKGVRFLNVNIDKFQFGIHARTLWHSNIHGCRITNCHFGVAYRGQCASASITATQIISLGSVFGDGSIGVHANSYIYADAVSRKPEAVLIDAETLVYGYDTNVWLQNCFIGSVVKSDIDAGLQYAIRVTLSDGNCTIKDNYICHLANAGAASYGVKIDDIGAANDSPINIEGNKVFGIGTMFSLSTSISIGYLHSGKKFVAKNKASGAQIALNLQDPASATVTDNVLDGAQYSLNTQNGGGNYYARNVFNGPIRRVGTRTRDTFDNNSGTAVTCYHGPITVPAGVTTVTKSLVTDLALPANPVTAAPASLAMKVSAHQWQGTTSRGAVRSYYDGAGNLVTTVGTAFGSVAGDIWVDMEAV